MATFVRVVETGSFSAAARQLHVGQPAVSKTVAQLEQHLNVSLLNRTTRGLTPTEAGLRYFERARSALHEAEEAELEARGAGAGLTGCLRLAAATTFARLQIVPLLPRFLAQHPGLDIDLVLDDRLIDYRSEGIDLSLRMGELADSSAVATRLATERIRVMASPAYLDRAGWPGHPSELAGHETVMYSQLPNVWRFERDGAQTSVELRGRLRISAAEGVRAAVLADMGLTLGSGWMFTPELADGSIREVLTDWALPAIDLWAIFPTGRRPSAKARAFARFVRAAMGGARAPSDLLDDVTR